MTTSTSLQPTLSEIRDAALHWDAMRSPDNGPSGLGFDDYYDRCREAHNHVIVLIAAFNAISEAVKSGQWTKAREIVDQMEIAE